jgi:hypothetical protein
MTEAQHTKNTEDSSATAHALQAAMTKVHSRIIGLITAWSQTKERYADLRSRARTPEARRLITRIRDDIEELERKLGSRVRKRREKSGEKLVDAIERFVGDLLRVRAGTTTPARMFRSTGKTSFERDPVKYDMFIKVLEGLKALELVSHLKGQTRYRKASFEPNVFISVALNGRAARFWATNKLLRLAKHYGVDGSNFAPEPPKYPLVLRGYGTGRGRNRERGPKIKFERNPKTERLEADVRELNEFVARFELAGGRHDGYTRVFNNGSWKAGGRLYGDGQHNYQQMLDTERQKMTINGEPVAEIDIKASHLTIYHARLGEPLKGSSDPYVLAGVDRPIAKLWMLASFGNSKPATRWPPEMIENFKKDTGKDLGREAKARDVARKMLAAFPALKKLEDHSDIWADLQFLEAEAVIGTMLSLMRHFRVPSLSMHDGIILPRSWARQGKTVLAREYRRVVGVEPMLTTEPKEAEVEATDL